MFLKGPSNFKWAPKAGNASSINKNHNFLEDSLNFKRAPEAGNPWKIIKKNNYFSKDPLDFKWAPGAGNPRIDRKQCFFKDSLNFK